VLSAFLLLLREGVEAALIVSILLAYVDRAGRRDQARWIWAGTLAAVLVSLAAGIAVFSTIGSLEGTAEEIAEGLLALVAAGFLTWMIFWMARQARTIAGRLRGDVDSALEAGGAAALAVVAFVAVAREGLESALFLVSTTVGESSNVGQIAGGLLGLAAAIGIGYLVFQSGRRINLRRFFRVTGLLIVFFAAGLVAKAIHEFQEAGVFGSMSDPAWTLSWADPDGSLFWRFMKTLFGWSPAPSIEMVAAYLAFLLPVAAVFVFRTRLEPKESRQAVSAS
jgi:high-affinity iron transporter